MKRIVRHYYLFVRDFFGDLFDDRLGFYAASMSWSTLFFITPFLMILLVLFTYMPFFNTVYADIHNLIAENLLPSNSETVINYIDTFVANAGKLGLIGIGYAAVAALLFFKDYDFIVNDIFETPQRRVWEALGIYTLLIFLLPLVLGVSFWLTTIVQIFLEKLGIGKTIPVHHILSYLLIWGLFYFVYQFSPRKKIAPSMAAISSFIASLTWYIAKSVFLYYVFYNKTYTSIYGGLSTLLFLFLWIYISWAIFLHGMRFCYLLDKGEEIEKI